MNIKLNEDDFDSYNIRIPVKLLIGKRRQNFLYKELDKRHPGFSNRYAYDERLKFSLKGFVSEVTVIDKLVLGSYKVRYPSCHLKNEKGKIVFDQKKYYSAFMTLLFMTLVFFILLYRIRESAEKQKKSKPEIITEEKTLVEECESIRIPGIYESILSNMSSASGKVKSFCWQYDGYTEKLSMEISGCYPTDIYTENRIEDLECSSVVMTRGVPSFSLEKKRIVLWGNQGWSNGDFSEELKALDFSEFAHGIRTILSEFNTEEERESYKPFCIQFKVKDLEMVLGKDSGNKILNYIEKACYEISELKILKNGNSWWNCEMIFIPGKDFPFSEPLLQVIKDRLNLFETINEVNKPQKPIAIVPEQSKSGKKVAVIRHDGRSENIYLKNDKGRIIHENK